MAEDTATELNELKSLADAMGVDYHPSIGLAKLKLKVAAADDNSSVEVLPEEVLIKAVPSAVKETATERDRRLKKEQTTLIRLQITCMNPTKSSWGGEIFTVGNQVVGSVRRYVPYNEPWHVESILMDMIEDRQCQVFQNMRENGANVMRGKIIKEFAIERLAPLTQEELEDLAQRQAMANGTSS